MHTGDGFTLHRISPSMIVLRPPEKLTLEIMASGVYSHIEWKKNDALFDTAAFEVEQPQEFPNFYEIFVRDPTTPFDFGIYEASVDAGIIQSSVDFIVSSYCES